MTIAELERLPSVTGQASRVTRVTRLAPACRATFPSPTFGDDGTHLPVSSDDRLQLQWAAVSLDLAEVHAFEFHDAVVHPPYGIITIDDYVVADTMAHVPFHFPGYSLDGDQVAFPLANGSIEVPAAVHAMAGGYANYYHWLLDTVPKMQIAPLAPTLSEGSLLLPALETRFQRDTLALFKDSPNPVIAMGRDFAVRARSLVFVPNLTGGGFVPNPHLASIFDRIREILRIDPAPDPSRRLYISRRDTRFRGMANESDVIAAVQAHGFEPVELSALPFWEQVELFASASHVIAPHGAGLANMVFCNEGARICEILVDNYINTCYRRLSSVKNLAYGHLVGEAMAETDRWTAPLDRLEALLPAFTA